MAQKNQLTQLIRFNIKNEREKQNSLIFKKQLN